MICAVENPFNQWNAWRWQVRCSTAGFDLTPLQQSLVVLPVIYLVAWEPEKRAGRYRSLMDEVRLAETDTPHTGMGG